MKRANTKHNKILRHLIANGDITSMDAIRLYGATRLAAIIFTLRKEGYNIETQMECVADRYGDNNHYARYIYHGMNKDITSDIVA